MALNVTDKKENKLFNRVEAVLEFESKGATPSRKQLLPEVASALGSKPGLVSITKIEQKYGRNSVTVRAKAYSSPEDLQNFEPSHLAKRAKADAPKEEASKETKPAAKEEKKEEKAEPEKKEEAAEPEKKEE